MNKYIVLFILFIAIVVGVAGFWYWQGGEISKDVLKLEIIGPKDAQSGEEVKYLVRFKNNGKFRLDEAELVFEYAEKAIPENSDSSRIIKQLEDIYPGEERMVEFVSHIFGKEGDILESKAWLSYKPKNIKSRYESKTSFVTQISFVPLTFEFDLPLKTESGEDIEFSLNYFSNMDDILDNLRVKILYPEGFYFLTSNPKAMDEVEWSPQTLSPADGGRISVKGNIEGDEGESKIFRAQLGVIKDSEFILLKEATESIEITEPSLHVSQLINGSQNYIAKPDDLLHYEVFFKNIGRTPIQKKFLFVKLEGDFFDFDTLKSLDGEVGRGDNSVIWDWKNVSDLRFLDAEEEGKVEFWVNLKETTENKLENPMLRNIVTIAGTQKVLDTRLNAKIQLAQKVYYNEDIFGNQGPLPPTVGQKTTYTILWQVRNSWNALENVKVKSILPEYIKPTGKVFPTESKFTYDSVSREVIWNVGALEAFHGFGEEETPLTLAIQVEYTPLNEHEGETVNIVENTDILAEDAFTKDILHEIAKPVSTTLPDDESVSDAQGVIKGNG